MRIQLRSSAHTRAAVQCVAAVPSIPLCCAPCRETPFQHHRSNGEEAAAAVAAAAVAALVLLASLTALTLAASLAAAVHAAAGHCTAVLNAATSHLHSGSHLPEERLPAQSAADAAGARSGGSVCGIPRPRLQC